MRSGFERTLAASLKSAKVAFEYEPVKLSYVLNYTYCPDFRLANGVYIEAKGVLDQATRSKMIAVKKAHPDLDIRFVFMNGKNRLSSKSKTTYMQWAEKNGFPAADGVIPEEWTK